MQRPAEPVQDVGADEFCIRRIDAIAGARVGHLLGVHFDGTDDVIGSYGDPRPHVVHGIAGAANTRSSA